MKTIRNFSIISITKERKATGQSITSDLLHSFFFFFTLQIVLSNFDLKYFLKLRRGQLKGIQKVDNLETQYLGQQHYDGIFKFCEKLGEKKKNSSKILFKSKVRI